MVDIPFRGNGNKARAHILSFIGQLTGREPDNAGHAKAVFYAIGFAALSDIQEAFIVKSRGGTGEDGVTWPPLSEAYLAYQRRFAPGEQSALKKAAGLGKGHSYGVGGKGGILTKAQSKRWKKLYGGNLARLAARMEVPDAKGMAAAMAWNTIKAEGARTKLEVFGKRVVAILRDVGILFNSLSPGYFDGVTYDKPTAEGGEQQVFTALTDGIVIGTNVPYAAAHNYGYPKSGIPKREFLPEVVPQVWLERWAQAGIEALADSLHRSLQGAA